jgi:hypothetical protein
MADALPVVTVASRSSAAVIAVATLASAGRSWEQVGPPGKRHREAGGTGTRVSGTKAHAMAAPRRFDLEDILNRPGTYFNPETEVLLVIDDAPEVDQDIFEEGAEGGDWVLIGDDVPLDERARDEVIERFEVRHHPGATSAPAEDDFEDEEEELEPDEEQPEL